MEKQILDIEVVYRTRLGVSEPVLMRTLPDNADSRYYKILEIKNNREKLYHGEYLTVLTCTIAVHGGHKSVKLVHHQSNGGWKLIM